MAFKRDPKPTFRATVTIDRIGEDGAIESGTFDGIFARKSDTELDELHKAGTPDKTVAALVLVGWGDDLLDDDDRPIPFSPEERARLLDHPDAVQGVITSYMFGRAALKKKS